MSFFPQVVIHVFFFPTAGIAGGVVTQKTFQVAFGVKASQVTTVSANVVSVLQAGAFFGALGSAPISCRVPTWSISDYRLKKNSFFFSFFFVYSMVRSSILQHPLLSHFRYWRRKQSSHVLTRGALLTSLFIFILDSANYPRWCHTWSWIHLCRSCYRRFGCRCNLSRSSRLRLRMLPKTRPRSYHWHVPSFSGIRCYGQLLHKL